MLPFSSMGGNCADSLANQNNKRNYLGSYLSDAGYLYTAPLRWKQKDWIKFGIISGIGIGLYSADDNILRWMIDSQTGT